MTRNEATKCIKAALKKKTGKTWSVSGGRGTGYGWMTIQAAKSNRVAHKLNPDHNGFYTISECIRKTGSPPWLEHVSDNGAENQYTTDADSLLLAEIFKTLCPYHHQGVSVSPENRERYVQLAEA